MKVRRPPARHATPEHDARVRRAPRNWPLMWRVTVIAAVPVLVALTVGSLLATSRLADAAALRTTTVLLEVRGQVAHAADLLRGERATATAHIAAGRTADWRTVVPVFGTTSAAIDGALTSAKNVADLTPTTSDALYRIRNGLVDLAPLRRAVIQQSGLTAPQARVGYTDLIGLLDTLDRALLRQVRAPESADLVDALSATVAVGEQLAQQRDILATAILTGALTVTDAALATAADTRVAGDYQTYLIALGDQRAAIFGRFLEGGADRARTDDVKAILGAPPNGPIPVRPDSWDQAGERSRAAVSASGDRLSQSLLAESRAAADRAGIVAGVGSGLILLVLLGGVAIAAVFGRSLVRALRVLQQSALEVASRRLPAVVREMRAGSIPDTVIERVPLDTIEEVGQVARAFDAVHSQAVHLAKEQAALQAGVSAMFVNLSRRSQVLVERQLRLIETLEAEERDADHLAGLFRLDHLATRMRRNSENLLVLAGTDLTPRSAPAVSIADVLRAAVSEIDKYERVVIEPVPAVGLAGRAASDVARLVAELLDNAVSFSPPGEPVLLRAGSTAGGSLVVEVADRGVGMTPDELRDANERLKGEGAVDLTSTRRMGLFVVGRLSARHGLTVRLTSGPHGTAAVVSVPAPLVESHRPSPRPRGPAAVDRRLNAARRPAPVAPARALPELGELFVPLVPADEPAGPGGPPDRAPARTGAERAGVRPAGSAWFSADPAVQLDWSGMTGPARAARPVPVMTAAGLPQRLPKAQLLRRSRG